jgi:hypothetical protein
MSTHRTLKKLPFINQMDSKIATPSKKQDVKQKHISPYDKTMASTAAPEPVASSKLSITYEAMIKEAFVQTFNKNKKLRE